jgi:flagellar basal-body rod modification protein FlgD
MSPTSSTPSLGSSVSLSNSDFFNLLVAQLQYQDPTNPMSSSDFVAQLAQLSTVNGIQSLNTNFSSMLSLQQLSGGSSLIGQTVSYLPTGTTTPVQGTVDSLSVNQGQVQLVVDGHAVPLSSVTGVQ